MSTSIITVVAWCRCGPFRSVLDELASEPLTRTVTWIGAERWVSENVDVRVGDRVELSEVDLCHRPGVVVPLRTGSVASVRRSAGRATIEIDVGNRVTRPTPYVSERGKLVARARAAHIGPFDATGAGDPRSMLLVGA